MVTVVVAPCSPFSVSPELMQASAALARAPRACACTRTSPRRSRSRPTASPDSAGGPRNCWTAGAGSPPTCGSRTASTSTTAKSRGWARPVPASRTVRRRTRGSRPACVGSTDLTRCRERGGSRRRRRRVERSGALVRRDATGAVHGPPARRSGRCLFAGRRAYDRNRRRGALCGSRRSRPVDTGHARRHRGIRRRRSRRHTGSDRRPRARSGSSVRRTFSSTVGSSCATAKFSESTSGRRTASSVRGGNACGTREA